MTLSTSSSPASAAFAPIPLWRQLQSTATVLVAIRAGQSATTALNDVETSLRPGVQALVFHVLRGLAQTAQHMEHPRLDTRAQTCFYVIQGCSGRLTCAASY